MDALNQIPNKQLAPIIDRVNDLSQYSLLNNLTATQSVQCAGVIILEQSAYDALTEVIPNALYFTY
jgi:hypothetical protein